MTRQEKMNAGICRDCTRPASTQLCDVCTTKRALYGQAYKETRKRNHQQLKREAFAAYGEKCICCGETEPIFLSIDHKQGNGTQHRKEMHSHTYRWLKRNAYPLGFQVLCHNCNHGRFLNGGTCPHQS